MKKLNNIKINKKGKGEVIITLNPLFYPKENILRVAEKFEEICWINLEGDPNGCLFLSLKPKEKKVDLEELGYEFMNHLLADIKEEVNW